MGKVIEKRTLLKALRGLGFKGHTLAEAKTFLDAEGVELKDGTEAIDIDRSWVQTKTVTIAVRADAGEQVEVQDMNQPEGAAGDPEDPEDPENTPKSGRRAAMVAAQRSAVQAAKGRNGLGVNPEFAKAFVGTLPQGGSAAIHGADSFGARRKVYNSKAKRGETVFHDADRAEVVAACFRLSAMGEKRYAQRDNDHDIVVKAGATYDNELGGILIPDGYRDELIELKADYGVARQLASVWTMEVPKETVPRLVNDVTMAYTGEGSSSDETEPTFDGVELVSHEISGITYQPLRLLRHSAVDIADLLARSFARATGSFEDTAYFIGDSKQQGLANKIGSNSKHTISGTDSFTHANITISEIQEWLGKLPNWVRKYRSEVRVTCSEQAYDQIFGRFEANAPGNTKEDLRTENGARWGGYTFVFNNTMASTWSSGVIAAYIGVFSRATKFGELAGSDMMRSSEHVRFAQRQMAWQAAEEFAVNPHDVNNTTESGVIALELTS